MKISNEIGTSTVVLRLRKINGLQLLFEKQLPDTFKASKGE